MILRNQAECLMCEEHILSIHKHDFKTCTCGRLYVDGGIDYLRRGGDPKFYRETSISIPDGFSLRSAAQYLGILDALGDSPVAGTTYLEGEILALSKVKPWYTVAKDKRELVKLCRNLKDWGLVEELTQKGDAQCYWKSNVSLARAPDTMCRAQQA